MTAARPRREGVVDVDTTVDVKTRIAEVNVAERAILAKVGVIVRELRLCPFCGWGVLVVAESGGRVRVYLSRPPEAAEDEARRDCVWLPRDADATPEGVAAVFSKWAREQRAAVRAAAAEAATGGGPCAAMGDPGAQPGGPCGGDYDERL